MTIIGLGRFIFAREKYQTEAADAPKVTFRDIREVMKSNPYIWIVAGIGFASSATGTGAGIYYFRWVVGDIALMSIVAIVPLVVLPIMLLFPWLMKKVGVTNIVTFGAISGVLGGAVLLLANGNIPLVLLGSLLGGIAVLPVTFLSQLLIIDNATYNQWAGRRRLESTMGAINNFFLRLGGGFGAALGGWVLALAAYDGTADTQPGSAITAIVILMGGIPVILWTGVILVMRPYRRLEKMLPTITQELAVTLADDPEVSTPAVDIEDELAAKEDDAAKDQATS